MKKIIILCVIGVLILGSSVGITVGIANQPENVALRSLQGAVEGFWEREEIALLLNTLSGGSVEVDYGGSKSYGSIKFMELPTFSGKFYFSEDSLFVEDFILNLSESETFTANAYFGNDRIYLENDGILNGAYGITKGSAADSFEASIFAPGSGSEFELEPALFDQVLQTLRSYDEAENTSALEKDARKLLDRLGKDLGKIFCDHAGFYMEDQQVEVSEELVSARVITITLTNDVLANILDDVYEYLLEDKRIPAFLEKHSASLSANMGEDDLSVLYEEFLESFPEQLDEIKKELFKEDWKLDIMLAVAKLGTTLYQLSMSLDDAEKFTIVGKDGIQNAEKVVFYRGKQSLVWEIVENTADAYQWDFYLKNKISFPPPLSKPVEPQELLMRFKHDKANETFHLFIDGGEYVKDTDRFHDVGDNYGYHIEGALSITDDAVRISLDTIMEKYVKGYSSSIQMGHNDLELDLSFVIREKDKMPSSLDEDDVEVLFAIAETEIKRFMEILEGILVK